jgi:SnoaL-like domain
MKVLRACALTAIVATMLSLGASVALRGEDNTVRETRDRHEIEALMWKYTRALDKGDGATYASTYTTDGEFGAGERVTKGREALSKLVRGQGPCPVSRILPDGLRGDGSRHAGADRGSRPEL